jgi:hypothetical protein
MNFIIFNFKNKYVKKSNIGKFGICEINNDNKEIINNIDITTNIFLETNYKEWLWLKNRNIFIFYCTSNNRFIKI